MNETMENKLEKIPLVDLPEKGRYRFVVVTISDGISVKNILKGLPGAEFHADIVDILREELDATDIKITVLGGGQIEVTEKSIYAFGHSSSYGTAPQDLVEELLRNHLTKNNIPQLNVYMGIGKSD